MNTANPFGVPLRPDEWAGLAAQAAAVIDAGLGAIDLDAFVEDAEELPPGGKELHAPLNTAGHDALLMEATGRWRIQNTYRAPTRLVPGDALALRALATIGTAVVPPSEQIIQYRDLIAVIDPRGTIRIIPEALQLATLLYGAESYWLPAGAEAAVLDSEPLARADAADLMLPHGSAVVWFAQPVHVPAGALLPTELLEVWRTDYEEGSDPPEPFAQAMLALRGCDPQLPGEPGDLVVEGVVLAADDDGRPQDLVLWATRTDRPDQVPDRVLIPGRRSTAGWRTPVELLSAVVAWGAWILPTEQITVGASPTRDELRHLRHGRTRRAEEAGGLALVRVLDLHARARPSAPRQPGGGTHASPITHLRRGHVRRVPVGPGARDREPRWIHPTVVNPGHEGPPRVYRLPAPPSADTG